MNLEIYSQDGEQGNIYFINANESNEVIIIDPGIFNVDLLNMIEAKNRTVKHVLITHSHPHCQTGLDTLLKIYRADVYFSGNLLKGDILSKSGTISLSGCEIEVIPIHGEIETDLIFRVNHSLFVGDLFSAGKIKEDFPFGIEGNTSRELKENLPSVAEENIPRELKEAFSSLQGFFYVFPGHGPPSTLDIERENLGL